MPREVVPLPYLSKLELANRICEQCRLVRQNPGDECLSRDELMKITSYLDVLGELVRKGGKPCIEKSSSDGPQSRDSESMG